MDDLKQLLKTIRCVSRNNPVTQLQLSEMCRVLYTDKYKLYLEKVNAVTRKSNSINENVDFAQALGQDHLLAGNQSTALGIGHKTTSYRELLFGSYATEKAGTYDTWVETDRLIGIGNGLDGDNRHDVSNIYKSGYAQLNNALRLGAFSWGTNIPEAGALQYTAVDGFRAYKNSLWNKLAFLNSDVEDSKLTYFDSLTGNLKTSAITKSLLENHLADVSTYSAKSVNTAAGQILSAFTSDAKGHVTGISLRSLVAADIPGLEISKITGLQTELDGKSPTHTHPYLSDSDSRIAQWSTAYGWGNHAGLYSALGHGHVIADVTGLQTALDGKLNYRTFGTAANSAVGDFAPSSGSANYVQVSPSSAQNGNIWIGKISLGSNNPLYRLQWNETGRTGFLDFITDGIAIGSNDSKIVLYAGGSIRQTIASTGEATFTSTVSATQLQSTVATGTAPLSVASTTEVTNLNANLLQGHNAAYFQTALTNPITGTGTSGYIPVFTGSGSLGNSIISQSGITATVAGNLNVADGYAYQYGGVDAFRLTKGTSTQYINTALGDAAGQSNKGDFQTATGHFAGYGNTGYGQIATGYAAGYGNTGYGQTATGHAAGYGNTGYGQTATGHFAGFGNTGYYVSGFGYEATRGNTAHNVVGIGYQAGYNNTVANQFIVKQANVNANALIQGDFATGAITLAGLTGTGTRLISATSAGQLRAITNGSDGQILTLSSGSPTWANNPSEPLLGTPAANGYVLSSTTSGVRSWVAQSAADIYKGSWDASTNTPTLANGTGTAGWYYICSTAGTVNFGAGNISFDVLDKAYYNGSAWKKISGSQVLQPATASLLGGVKIGSGVTVQSDGTISVSTNYQSPLSGTGFVKSSAGTISYDTNTYLTGITSSQVTTALGYIPYNSSNPSGYATQSWVSSNFSNYTAWVPYCNGVSGGQGVGNWGSFNFQAGSGISISLSNLSLTISATDTNNYPTALAFSGGYLNLSRSGLSDLSVSLDGRYSLLNHTHDFSSLFAANGNGYFNGSITATSFIRQNGTASQFLKADGSVDSNSYSLSNHNHAGIYQPVGNYVLTSDSRLSDSRPASDVYAWAKASTKPSYTYSEVGAAPSSTVSFPGYYNSGGDYGTGYYAARYDHLHSQYLTSSALSGYATQNWVTNNFASSTHTHDFSSLFAAKSNEGKVRTLSNSTLAYLGADFIYNSATNSIVLVKTDQITSSNEMPVTASAVYAALSAKQATLVSGTNIRTVNGNSLLGSGDIAISSNAVWGGITGSLSNQTDLVSALSAKAAKNGSASEDFLTSSLILGSAWNSGWMIQGPGSNLGLFQNGTLKMTFGSDGIINAYDFALSSSSDIRLKRNITAIHRNLDAVSLIQFSFNSDCRNRTRYGVIAQELEEVAPEMVHTDARGMKSVNYTDFLIAKVANLESKIKQLEQKICQSQTTGASR